MTPDALLGPEGAELLAEVCALDPGEELAAGERLRRRFPPDLVATAFAQAELRRRAGAKFSRAAELLFTRSGLEQASAEPVARHRARRYAGTPAVVELCVGIGGDLVALAGAGPAAVLAVDRDPVHLRLAAHNAAVYGGAAAVTFLEADVRDAPLAGADAVFIDPARRASGRRFTPGGVQTEPPLAWCLALAGTVPRVGIKAAPGLPHAAAPDGWELEFVAEGRELKEASLWSPAWATARGRATVLPSGESIVAGPGAPVPVRPPAGWLLDPSPAVTRAGAVEALARAIGAWKIDERIAFLSLDHAVHTPFGRTLRVLDASPWDLRAVIRRLRELGAGAVDVRRRGLGGDVDDVTRRLRRALPGEGAQRITVVMTRVADRPTALLCTDPDPAAGVS